MTTAIKTGSATAGRQPMSRIPPLRWWRGERRRLPDVSAIGHLRDTLTTVYLPQVPRWPAAVGGNADAAVSIGLYVAADPTSPGWLLDHVGSLLLMCAAEGCEAAARVLRHLRRRHGVARRGRREGEV